MRIIPSNPWFWGNLIVILLIAFFLAQTAFGSGKGEIPEKQNPEIASDATQQSPVFPETVNEPHACSHSQDKDFICPNANNEAYALGEGKTLQTRCSSCPRQAGNGGSCPGKYI